MKMKRLLTVAVAIILVYTGSASASLTDGLVAYYLFDGNSNDETGNYNGTEFNGVSYSEGVDEQAAFFDGVDDYILTNTVIGTWINWSASVFVKTNEIKTAKIIEREKYGFYHDFEIGLTDQNLIIVETDLGDNPKFYSSDSLVNNKWYHLAVTYNGTEKWGIR